MGSVERFDQPTGSWQLLLDSCMGFPAVATNASTSAGTYYVECISNGSGLWWCVLCVCIAHLSHTMVVLSSSWCSCPPMHRWGQVQEPASLYAMLQIFPRALIYEVFFCLCPSVDA